MGFGLAELADLENHSLSHEYAARHRFRRQKATQGLPCKRSSPCLRSDARPLPTPTHPHHSFTVHVCHAASPCRELRGEGSAGVLISEDGGSTWSVHAHLQAPETWLIENTITELASGGPTARQPAHTLYPPARSACVHGARGFL